MNQNHLPKLRVMNFVLLVNLLLSILRATSPFHPAGRSLWMVFKTWDQTWYRCWSARGDGLQLAPLVGLENAHHPQLLPVIALPSSHWFYRYSPVTLLALQVPPSWGAKESSKPNMFIHTTSWRSYHRIFRSSAIQFQSQFLHLNDRQIVFSRLSDKHLLLMLK